LLPPWKLLLLLFAGLAAVADGSMLDGTEAAGGFTPDGLAADVLTFDGSVMVDGLATAGEFGIALDAPGMGCGMLGAGVWACATPAMPRAAASATVAVRVRFI
jgi:hypothetical protein